MDTIGQKLDLFFRTVTKLDGSEYNHREVAEGIGNKASSAYLWRISNNKSGAQKLGFEIIEALAEFFQHSSLHLKWLLQPPDKVSSKGFERLSRVAQDHRCPSVIIGIS